MKTLFSLLILILSGVVYGQTPDDNLFHQKMTKSVANTQPARLLEFGKSFLDKPYVGGTLEGNSTEKLVCNLQQFDCWTFVENVVSLSLTKKSGNESYENYQDFLKKLRYRDGVINGYGSRLHYFIEWMYQAEKNGYLKNITKELGGEVIEKPINFMTAHRSLYPSLADAKAFLKVQEAANRLNLRKFVYIPKNKVSNIESKIKEGDIIAITSAVAGLDVNHEGFAVKKNGRIHLLHASQELKKVVISDEPLSDYLNRIKKHSGIIVMRANE